MAARRQETYAPDNSSPGQASAGQGSLANYPGEPFVAAVLGDTEDRWTEILAERNVTYTAPKLVLFSRLDALGLRPRGIGHGSVLLPE